MSHTLTKQTIERKLRAAFQPSMLDVVDESHKHASHAGVAEHGGGHFVVRIASEALKNVPRIARQRMVQRELTAEFEAHKIHALSIKFIKGAQGR